MSRAQITVDFDSKRPSRLLSARLSESGPLNEEVQTALAGLPYTLRYLRRDEVIADERGAPRDLLMVLDGAAARYKTMRSGERPIVGFLLPGDVFDWPQFAFRARGGGPRAGTSDSIGAMSRCVIVAFRRRAVLEALEKHPSLFLAFDRAALTERAIMTEWLANLASRPGPTRLAHVLLEYYYRSKAVGLAHGHSCAFMPTQVHLSVAQGVSLVHTNRLLQRLRADGLLTVNGHVLTMLDQDRLEHLADFNPEYLGHVR